jgi:hypothetical protein
VSELASNGVQTALEAQLSQAREKLDALVRNLRVIDGEMDALSTERQQYHLLDQVCSGLQELDELGAASLFWGEGTVNGAVQDHLRLVRGRVDAFQKRLDEIEERRQAVIEEIERAQESAELVEDDLLEAQRQEEQKQLEWVVEREGVEFPARPAVMPWHRSGEDDQRFRKALLAALLLSLLLGLVFPMIDLPLPEPWAAEEIPERYTRLIREEQPLPPPPPVQEEMKLAETEPELAKESAPAPKTPEAVPKQSTASKGILAFREKFSSLADSEPAARLGAQARIRNPGEAAFGRSQRSMVTTQGQGSSGGIDIGSLSRDVGGGGDGDLEGVQIARATTSIGNGGGSDRPLAGDGPGLSRTDEEIQIVFDRHKAGLYRLYNRELRRDPTLKGQMVLRIRIEPDGTVSLCELQSTDMKAPQLSAQVLERVRTFDFGAKEDIPAITILYPIDFLPAA